MQEGANVGAYCIRPHDARPLLRTCSLSLWTASPQPLSSRRGASVIADLLSVIADLIRNLLDDALPRHCGKDKKDD